MVRLLIILAFLPVIALGQTAKQKAVARKLKEYYPKSINNSDSLKYQRLFFDSFPNNFSDFKAIYDHPWSLDTGQIFFFFELENVPERELYQKIINISIGGRWNADAVNFFQSGLRDKVFANPKLTFDLLKNKPDAEIKSFFFFFYHSIHPLYKKIPGELTKMKSYNGRIYRLMEKGLKDALKQSNGRHDKWE